MADETIETSVTGEEQILQLAGLLAAILGIESESEGPASKFKSSLDLVAAACSNTGNITKYIEELKKLKSELGGISTDVKNPTLTSLFNSNKDVSRTYSNLASNFNAIDVTKFFSEYSKKGSDSDVESLRKSFDNEIFRELRNDSKRLSNENSLGVSRKEAEARIKENNKNIDNEAFRDLQNVAKRLSNENPKQEIIAGNLVNNLKNIIEKFNIQNPGREFSYSNLDRRNFDIIKSGFAAHKSNIAIDSEYQKEIKSIDILNEKIAQLQIQIQKFNSESLSKFSSAKITPENYDLVKQQFKTHKDNVNANLDNTPLQNWEAKDLFIKAARVGLDVNEADIKTKGDATRLKEQIRNKPYEDIEYSYMSVKDLASQKAFSFRDKMFNNVDKATNLENGDKTSLKQEISTSIDNILKEYEQILNEKRNALFRANKSPEVIAEKFKAWESNERFLGLNKLLNNFESDFNFNKLTALSSSQNLRSHNSGGTNLSANAEADSIVLIQEQEKKEINQVVEALKNFDNALKRHQESEENLLKAEKERNDVFNNIVSSDSTQKIKNFNIEENIAFVKDFITKAINEAGGFKENLKRTGTSDFGTIKELNSLINLLGRANTQLSYIKAPDKLQGIVDNSSDAYKLRDFFSNLNSIDTNNLKDSASAFIESLRLLKTEISPIIDKIRSQDNTFLNDSSLSKLSNNKTYDIVNTLGNISYKIPETVQAVRKAERENENYAKSARDAEREVKKLEEASHRLGRSLDENLLRSLNNLERRFAYNNGFSRVFSLLGQAVFKNTNFGKFGQTERRTFNYETKKWENVIDRQGVNLGSLLGGGLGIALNMAVTPIINDFKTFFKNTLANFGDIQAIKTNLGVVYGSQSEADNIYKDISEYALKSPFGVEKISEFAVLLKQSGVYSTELLKTLKMIGDVAGGNQTKFQRIANNYAQIVANGKATALDMRQFANAGLPIYKEIEKITGKSTAEIRKMTSNGKLTASIIEKAFSNMTQEGGVFYKGVEKGAKTYKAQVQNLSDIKKISSAELGEAIFNIKWPTDFAKGNEGSWGQDILNTLNNIYETMGRFFNRYNTAVEQNESVNFFSQYTSLLNNLSDIQEKRRTNNDPFLAIAEDELKEALKNFLGRYSFTDEMANASARVKNTVIESKTANENFERADRDLTTIRDFLGNNKLGGQSYADLVSIVGSEIIPNKIPNKYKKIITNNNYSPENVETQSQVNDIFKIGRSFTTDEKKNIYDYKKLLDTINSLNTILNKDDTLSSIFERVSTAEYDFEADDYRVDFFANRLLNKVAQTIQSDKVKNQEQLSQALNSNNGLIYKNLDVSSKVAVTAENTQKTQRSNEDSAYSLNEFMRLQYEKSNEAKQKEKDLIDARIQKARELYETQQKYDVKPEGLDWANKNGAFYNKVSKKYDVDKFYELYNLFSSGTAIEINDPSTLTDADVKEIENNFNNLYNFIVQSVGIIKDINLKKETFQELTKIRNNLNKYKNATTENERIASKNNFANAYANLLNIDEKNSLGYRLKDVDNGRLADLITKTRIRTVNDISKKEWFDIDDGKKKKSTNYRPLWERFSIQTLGIPAQVLSALNNKGGVRGFDNKGNAIKIPAQTYAGQYFTAMNNREENTAIVKSMLASGISPLQMATLIKQQPKFVGANNFNRTQSVAQNLTNLNLRNFALNAFSDKSITDAMLSSIGNSLEKIDTFFAGAAFQMEDASMAIEDYSAQLDKSTYDAALQAWNQLSYGYNRINQLKDDINPFSLSLKDATNGTKTFAEFLPKYLDEYRKNLKALQESTATLSAVKSVFNSFAGDSFKERQEQYKLSASLRGSYKTGNSDFDSSDFDIQNEIIAKLQEALNSQTSLKSVADVITNGQGFSIQMVERLIGKYGTNLSTYSEKAEAIAEKLAKENGVTSEQLQNAKTDSEKQFSESVKHTALLSGIYEVLGGSEKTLLELNKESKVAKNAIKKTVSQKTSKEDSDIGQKREAFYLAKSNKDNYYGSILNKLKEDADLLAKEGKFDKATLKYEQLKHLLTEKGQNEYFDISGDKKAYELDEKVEKSFIELKNALLNSRNITQGTETARNFEKELAKILHFDLSQASFRSSTSTPISQPAPSIESKKSQQNKSDTAKNYVDLLDEIIDIWREEQKSGIITSKGYDKYIKSSFNAVNLRDRLYNNPDISPETIEKALGFGKKSDLNWLKGGNSAGVNYLNKQGDLHTIYLTSKQAIIESDTVTPPKTSPSIDNEESKKSRKDLLYIAESLKNDKTSTAFKKFIISNGYDNNFEVNTAEGLNTKKGVKIEGNVATDTLSSSRFNWKDWRSFFDGGSIFNIFGNGTRKFDGSFIDRHGYYDSENKTISWNTAKEERALTYLREKYEGFDNIKTSKDLENYLNKRLKNAQKVAIELNKKTYNNGNFSGFEQFKSLEEKIDNKETLTDEEDKIYIELQNGIETLKETNQFLSSFQNMGISETAIPFFNEESKTYQVKNKDGTSEDVKTEDDSSKKGSGKSFGKSFTELFVEDFNKDNVKEFTEGQLKGLKERFGKNITESLTAGLSDSLVMWGEMTKEAKSLSDIIDSFKDQWKNVAASMMKVIGADITHTGLQIAAANAMVGNWGGVAGGLALAASGGIMSFTSGILSGGSKESDKDDGREEKIQNLKDALSDLIDQAKTDAEYYQKNLLHKNALAENENISTRSVNDAIITPNGSIVTTHPDDYLIATKTPGSLINAGNKGNNYSPNITFSVINASGQNVEISNTEESIDENGDIDIRATIVAVTGEAIANGELDEAFSAMQYRQQGSPSVIG